jgi:hypothetical protein
MLWSYAYIGLETTQTEYFFKLAGGQLGGDGDACLFQLLFLFRMKNND